MTLITFCHHSSDFYLLSYIISIMLTLPFSKSSCQFLCVVLCVSKYSFLINLVLSVRLRHIFFKLLNEPLKRPSVSLLFYSSVRLTTSWWWIASRENLASFRSFCVWCQLLNNLLSFLCFPVRIWYSSLRYGSSGQRLRGLFVYQ